MIRGSEIPLYRLKNWGLFFSAKRSLFGADNWLFDRFILKQNVGKILMKMFHKFCTKSKFWDFSPVQIHNFL